MASVTTDPRGNRRILYIDPTAAGGRRTIALGGIDKRTADGIRGYVERLANAKRFGLPIDYDAAAWLAKIGDALHGRLAAAGLVPSRHAIAVVTLADIIDTFTSRRGGSVKASTRAVWTQARNHLIGYFGGTRPAADITPADADDFRRGLRAKYSEATTAKMTMVAKAFFRDAVRRKVIDASPFAGIANGSQRNPDRQRFIDPATIAKCIDAAPDAEWRLLIVLARYGGLRVPSEPLALRWADVNWGTETMIVRSSKTERHAGGASRVVPIFPELLPHLREAFERAESGAEYVITGHRGGSNNLRTRFGRIINRAGITPWPRLWQNLRASRATELADRFPGHVCAAWLGHTEAIADRHYRQVTADHLAAAVASTTAVTGAADTSLTATQIATRATPATHIPTQQPAALTGNGRKQTRDVVLKTQVVPANAAGCDPLQTADWAIRDSNPF